VEARLSGPILTVPEAHLASCSVGTGSLAGVKVPGRCAGHQLAPRMRVDRQLYQYLPSVPSLHVTGLPSSLPPETSWSRTVVGKLTVSALYILWSPCLWEFVVTSCPWPDASRHTIAHYSLQITFDIILPFVCTDHDLTLRWLMSYIYGAPILDVSRSHTTTQHSR